MEFCLTAMMRRKAGEKYSVFLFLVGEQGRDVFNTINWKKKKNAEGNPTDEVNNIVRLVPTKELSGGEKKILLEKSK